MQEGKVISNNFNIYSVMKILFRRKGPILVGRFDRETSLPMTALNPLTNNRIIGEVEFFFIENPYLKIEPKEKRYPTDKPLSLHGCKGIFIGSDYSYIHSPNLVQTIKDNCLTDAQDYLNFQNFRNIDRTIQRLLESNGQGEDGMSVIDAENNIHQVVYENFVKSNEYFESGFILGIYRILGIIAFLISLAACFSENEEKKA